MPGHNYLDPAPGRGYISAMPRRPSKEDSPAKLAGRMKRRWRVVLLRAKGEILGTVERQPRQPQRSSLIWTKSSATGSWCRSLAKGGATHGNYNMH
jgi:hypothetical protein